jgi:hypothetical protein
MDWAPWARIIIRYGVGVIVGADSAGMLAGDADVVTIVALGIGGAVEVLYAIAKRKGWAT